MIKKRTYIVKIGIRLHSATTDREQACLRAQQLYGQGKDVHLWSRPYRAPCNQLVEEDFWASDGPDVETVAPPQNMVYIVMRDGEQYHTTTDRAKAGAMRDELVADGIQSEVVERVT